MNKCYGFTFSEAKALAEVNQLVPGDAPPSLLAALHNEHVEIVNIKDENQLHYSTLLQAALQAKRQVNGSPSHVSVGSMHLVKATNTFVTLAKTCLVRTSILYKQKLL